MRTFSPFLALLLVFLQVHACHQNHSDQVLRAGYLNGQSNALGFATESYERRSENCSEDMPCANMVAVYPRADRGPRDLVKLVNDSIQQYLRLTLSGFTPSGQQIPPDIDSIARQFIMEYERFQQDFDSEAPPWTVETKGSVLFQSPRVLSLELDNFSFTGGAHPNRFRVFLVFDLMEKKMLDLEDMILDREKFGSIVESAFRRYHGLGPDRSLNEAGFFWDEPFFLPANAALTEEGLTLLYNPYEAAPYATGATELTIPYTDLKGIIRDEFIPSR